MELAPPPPRVCNKFNGFIEFANVHILVPYISRSQYRARHRDAYKKPRHNGKTQMLAEDTKEDVANAPPNIIQNNRHKKPKKVTPTDITCRGKNIEQNEPKATGANQIQVVVCTNTNISQTQSIKPVPGLFITIEHSRNSPASNTGI